MNAARAEEGWKARLELEFESRGVRTVLVRRRHEGPLLVQRPFHPEGAEGACHVYLIHPPGGVVGGDELTLEAYVRRGARALLTTPAAGKFYRNGAARQSRVHQRLCADDGALEWLPQENIFYPDAEATVSTGVWLEHDARFIGWELACLGLPASGLSLGGGAVRLRFELWRDGRPRLIESLLLGGENLDSRYGLAGLPVLGTLIASPAGEKELAVARASVAGCAEPAVACTLIDRVLAARSVARDTSSLRSVFERLWRVLRPEVVGRPAIAPRIWAT